jgi:hypothetical protein
MRAHLGNGFPQWAEIFIRYSQYLTKEHYGLICYKFVTIKPTEGAIVNILVVDDSRSFETCSSAC